MTGRQASPAASFVQHCHRCLSTSRVAAAHVPSTSATGPLAQKTPDFLLPFQRQWRSRDHSSSRSGLLSYLRQQRHALSSTAQRFAAAVTQNPRTDDDGNALWINISDRAATVRDVFCLVKMCHDCNMRFGGVEMIDGGVIDILNFHLRGLGKLHAAFRLMELSILSHTTTGCGKQGFPSAQPYLSHTPAG
jgi:hypothetical protein